MKKRFDRIFPWLFVIGDLAVMSFSIILLSFLMGDFGYYNGPDRAIFSIFIMVWMVITILRKDYRWERTSQIDALFGKLIVSLLWFLVIVAILWVPVLEEVNSLLFFSTLSFTLFLFLSFYRVGTFLVLRKYRSKGFNFRNAVILGNGQIGGKLAEVLHRRRDFGIRFMGHYDFSPEITQDKDRLKEFFEEAVAKEIDIIYIQELRDAKVVKKLIDFADEHYIKVKVIPGNALQLEKQLSFSRYGDLFVINVNEIPLDLAANRIMKRAFDVVFSLFVTVFILSWLIPLVGLLIKLESKGPVFFIQERNGFNNKVFNCLKFRSMTPNDYADEQQAKKGDPRVTRIGAFLRSTSLDEMPQFLNVLMGDMSIVGPRPHTVPMNKEFKTKIEKYNSRHMIKPGITGLAQVRGFRGEIENPYQIRSRFKLDYFYIKNWSIWLDLKICVQTCHELIYNRENVY
ncbi:exopolysaccharide biosynthesis polyprenyl glycosylphosphotransferase [Cecembia lonarensis]|uniref:Putative colanic biosynthesis UDP-glucose lipid carrier transferase n=1 Tax=Cecembia lonarensis (strain CCUG 58316 / KCTC 22772 / LW9) TaxID=1225176 RepID=K1L815_CECL9|nr:exopolysaccharide biosynthesis polyprenyl glycosylphosphotransferase [Cecembia lonarensis]EKB50811.1 Putative colanic biosynthesis UDP-glucose lipid carrier transferase [Cecembia lonarensis LW9]